MVRNNVYRNINICHDAGLTNYFIEVVTDKAVSIVENEFTREVVVPPSYATRSGAMFKARALQYALEDEVCIYLNSSIISCNSIISKTCFMQVNTLKDTDWIVHLDEETILTEGSVKGIVNFICEGQHQFGQGVITYVNDGVTIETDGLRKRS